MSIDEVHVWGQFVHETYVSVMFGRVVEAYYHVTNMNDVYAWNAMRIVT